MIILSNFIHFCNFALSLLQFLIFFGYILDSFELVKLQTHNTRAMAKYKKVDIPVTYQQDRWFAALISLFIEMSVDRTQVLA